MMADAYGSTIPMIDAAGWLNRVHCADGTKLRQIVPAESVHLVAFSPPYNVGMGYEAGQTFDDWVRLMQGLALESFLALVPGGRIAVNVANVDRDPYRPLNSYIWGILARAGFIQRGEVIWDKGASVGTSTAWGSWRSPSQPTFRDVHEYILVAQKPGKFPGKGRGDITAREFVAWTKSRWEFPTVSAKRIGREAVYPLELPYRLIKLFTRPGDIVLDPTAGAGTTLLAADMLGRNWVGVDQDPEAVRIAEEFMAGQRARPDASPLFWRLYYDLLAAAVMKRPLRGLAA